MPLSHIPESSGEVFLLAGEDLPAMTKMHSGCCKNLGDMFL